MRCLLSLLGLALLLTTASAQQPKLPRQVSLVPQFQRLALPPRVQGKRDTCSSFAMTALAEFESAKAGPKRPAALSEEFLIWAANDATGRVGDQAMFYEALHGLNARGICHAGLMPYVNVTDNPAGPSPAALADGKAFRGCWKAHWIRRWDTKQVLSDGQLLAIKEAIAAEHPVACGLRWPKVLRGHAIAEVPPPDQVFDGHSILLVGYQDSPAAPGGGAFLFRNSEGPSWGNGGYGLMSYDYVRAYANDALSLTFEKPIAQLPVRLEAESLAVLSKSGCSTNPQEMKTWGAPMWSEGRQLFCKAQGQASVVLNFTVSKTGRYQLGLLATAAPDFGTIRLALNDKALEPDIDLYSGRVSPSGISDLGKHDLTAGSHRLSVTCVAKNNASTGFSFGLDAIELAAID